MANIIVCYKWVTDEADIRFNPSNSNLDTSRANHKISEYDRHAIEEGVKVRGTTGDELIAITFGNSDAKKSIKDVLSRGATKACWVNDDLAVTADGFVTAEVLAAAIKKIGDYKLIICAEGASDTFARQVGPRIGAILDIPVISSVYELSVEGNQMTAKRKLEEVVEYVTIYGPAVICVLPEINKPPVPSLKAALEASKKPVVEYKVSDLVIDTEYLQPKTRLKSLKAYTMDRKNILFNEGNGSERVKQLVDSLRKEGVI